MRRIINSTFITLDGVIGRPHEWPSVGDWGSKGDQMNVELIQACDALIMGRRTYEGFAAAWPTRSGDPFSDHINAMPKHVVTSRLADPEWNNTSVLSGDPVTEIQSLKEQSGKNILQYGFGQLSFALMEKGLLDELRLWVHPQFIGDARQDELLYRDCPATAFDLVDTTSLDNGVVIISYRKPVP